MNTTYLKKVRQFFACGQRHIDRHNQLSWVRSVRRLGDKWHLKQTTPRLATPNGR